MTTENSKPDFLDDPTVHPVLKRLLAAIIVGGAEDLAHAVELLAKKQADKPDLLRQYHRVAAVVGYEFKAIADRALKEAERLEREANVAAAAIVKAAKEGA